MHVMLASFASIRTHRNISTGDVWLRIKRYKSVRSGWRCFDVLFALQFVVCIVHVHRCSDPVRPMSLCPLCISSLIMSMWWFIPSQLGWHMSPFVADLRPSAEGFNLSGQPLSTGDDYVSIKILYCGICHSDLHSIKNEWKNTTYPIVAGHEIAGVVTEVGKNVVGRFKPGDRVGVGCMVNSCRSCDRCDAGFENHCPGIIFTYNSVDVDGTITYGGYSTAVVVHERFVVRFPDALPLDKGAPLLCAGITVYSPMKYHGLLDAPGEKHVGVLGLGGLGHVAVKFAKAFGMKVTVISSSPGKRQEALERLGADAFVVSKDAGEMKAAVASMDGIINTVSANIPLAPLMGLLKPNGKMIVVGLPEKPLEIPPFDLIMWNKTLAGSCIGGMKDTQEMLDLAAKHDVTADVEVIGADYVNTALERLAKADVRYRFVIDIGNTLNQDAAAAE